MEVIRPHRRLSQLEKEERQARISADGNSGEDITEITANGDSGGWIGIFRSKRIMSGLLLFVPVGFLAFYLDWSPIIIFSTSFLALIPLAGFLGDFTEQVAVHTNAAIGALLNASFGNATELIICVIAVKKGKNDLVQLTLLGSVLGNMLLVLGTAFLLAGAKKQELNYNLKAVNIYGSLLVICVAALAVPSMFALLPGENITPDGTLWLSRILSSMMVVYYVLYLFFSLRTHKYLFDDEGADDEESDVNFGLAVFFLGAITILISFHSDFLVDAVEPTAQALGLSYMFIAVILIPIVGNVAEHAAAIVLAMKGKMDVAIGIAIGSSIQIALFMIPFMVLVAWAIGGNLSLNFHFFSVILVVLSVLVVKSVTQDGSSNWFEGCLLMGMYVAVAASYLFVKGEHIV